MTQSIAPIPTARRHRTILVGAVTADSLPPYAVGIRTSRSARPGVLSCNEALFPDRARCFTGPAGH